MTEKEDESARDENGRASRDIETARLKIETERLELERARHRSTLPQLALQLGLPLLISVIALGFNAYSERQRRLLDHKNAELKFNKAVSSYNDGRLELFRKRADLAKSDDQIKSINSEVFPRDALTLTNEQQAVNRK